MDVFDCYIQCNLAAPDGIRGSLKNGNGGDSDDDDINDSEDPDRIRYKEVLGNKSKQMKINDIFDYFTSKAYSSATLSRNFHFYQLRVPKQLTKNYQFSVKCDIFKSAVLVL